jgi:hypothetical protein
MKIIKKITTVALIFVLVGCSSVPPVPHNKTTIYGKTLNERQNLYNNNPNIRSNTNYETNEINRIVKHSENNTFEECEIEKAKDLETVLEILNESSIQPLIKKQEKYAIIYENEQFRMQQTNCSKNKKDLYIYELIIDSKTEAAKSLMDKIGEGLTLVILSPVIIFGYILMGVVNGVLYLDKVANEK